MVLIELKEDQKWEEVMEKKKRLKGRKKKERIGEDLTWKERKMKWKLGEIAKMEKKRGERTWIKNRRIRIGDKRWRWDKEKKVLKDERGNIKKTETGEEEGQIGKVVK